MNGWMDELMNGWMDEWMNGWMDEWMNGWTTVISKYDFLEYHKKLKLYLIKGYWQKSSF